MTNNRITNNTILVKKTNTELIREIMREQKTATRNEIASKTGLSSVTSGTILNEMLDSGELLIDKFDESSGGRPARRFKYNKDFLHIACISISYDFSLKSIEYIIADSYGEIIEKKSYVHDIVTYDTIDNIAENILASDSKIKALTVSIPGESYNGTICICDIKELENVPLEKKLRSKYANKYNVNIFVEGESHVLAYGYYNCHSELSGKSLVVLSAPKNLHMGAGIIVDGQLVRGDRHLAGEVSFISGTLSRDDVLKHLSNQEFYLTTLSVSLTSLISIINPSKVVLCGGAISNEMYKKLLKSCSKSIPPFFMPEIEVTNNMTEYLLSGLINITISHTSTGIQLIKR